MERMQVTEEQAREMLVQISEKHQFIFNIVGHEETIARWKESGYIKKSILEEAEEVMKKRNDRIDTLTYADYFVLCDTIQYLKEQLKR